MVLFVRSTTLMLENGRSPLQSAPLEG